MPPSPMIDPSEHPMVISAIARLATQGGWARMLAGKPLEDELDLNDAELLVAAQVLRRNPDDTFEPVDTHPWYFDPVSLAGGLVSYLRRALRHAEGVRRAGPPRTSTSSSPRAGAAWRPRRRSARA